MTTGIEAIDRSVDAAAEQVLAELIARIIAADQVLVAAARWQDAKLDLDRARDQDGSSGSSIVVLADAEASALTNLWDVVTCARQKASSAHANRDSGP